MIVPGDLVLERYRVGRELRRGRRGAVHAGWLEELESPVELAVLDDLGLESATRDRILADVEKLRKLRDPALTEVREVGLLDDGSPCVVMEPLEGRSLAGLLADRGPLPWPEAARVGEVVAHALDAKHAAGVLHGELAPDDVVIGETGMRLTAVGVGRSHQTPEPGTDLASLGVILAETLTGNRPGPGPLHLAAPAGLPPIPAVFIDLVTQLLSVTEHGKPSAADVADKLADLAQAGRKSTLKSRD
jgi:serine/threonine protein kinase